MALVLTLKPGEGAIVGSHVVIYQYRKGNQASLVFVVQEDVRVRKVFTEEAIEIKNNYFSRGGGKNGEKSEIQEESYNEET